MIEQSLDAEKMYLSSGEMTRQVMGNWWPRSILMSDMSGGCNYSENTSYISIPNHEYK